MIKNVSQQIDKFYDRDNQFVEFPTILDNIASTDAKFEFLASNTLQKVRLIRKHNKVAESVAVIFQHTRVKDLNYKCAKEKAELYRKTF